MVAIRSVNEKSEIGTVVDVRRESRTCEPVGHIGNNITGPCSLECEGVEAEEGGNKRMFMSFLRKGIFVDVGESADCMMCVVVG